MIERIALPCGQIVQTPTFRSKRRQMVSEADMGTEKEELEYDQITF